MPAVKYFFNELPIAAAPAFRLPQSQHAGFSYLFFVSQNKLFALHQYYYCYFLFKHVCDE